MENTVIRKLMIAGDALLIAVTLFLSCISFCEIQEVYAQDYIYAEGLKAFTQEETDTLRENFRIPDNIAVTGIDVADPYYWEGAGVWVMSVSLFSGDQLLASASVDPESLDLMRNIYGYSEENVDLNRVVFQQQENTEPTPKLSAIQIRNALNAMNLEKMNEYILPESDSRYLSASELSGLDAATLRLARNEIYARHGRRFRASDLQSYFDGKSWYSGTVSPEDFSESVFNSYEKANLKLIQDAEKK